MYRIKIKYETGNSYNTSSCSEFIDIQWEDLDVAKNNLQRIKSHYEQYREINGFGTKRKTIDILKSNILERWFVNVNKLFCISSGQSIDEKHKEKFKDDWEYRPDQDIATRCLYLLLDNGNILQYSAFWCGYFESLYSASIELDDSDWIIEF